MIWQKGRQVGCGSGDPVEQGGLVGAPGIEALRPLRRDVDMAGGEAQAPPLTAVKRKPCARITPITRQPSIASSTCVLPLSLSLMLPITCLSAKKTAQPWGRPGGHPRPSLNRTSFPISAILRA